MIRDCKSCGGKMRLTAIRMSVNRKRGVAHAIAHVMLKPYPKLDADKPWFQMIERWNAANA
jgi:hypothetical protein